MIADQKKELILQEQKHDIKILYTDERGGCVWSFASAESDWDVFQLPKPNLQLFKNIDNVMKTLVLIFFCLVSACTNSTQKKETDKITQKYPQLIPTVHDKSFDSIIPNMHNMYIDSAHFHIIRNYYLSGMKHFESYQNKLSKLDYHKNYYPNGQLKEEGQMTNGNHVYIGLWKYYSPAGVIDSVINYDNMYPISYFEALQIAEEKGFRMPDIEVTLQTDSSSTFWQITRWMGSNNDWILTAEVINIDTHTGLVTKPKYTISAIL